MFVSFSVENYRSYKHKATFDFIKDQTKPISKENLRNVGIILGGNASGKSNLFKAIFGSKLLIIEGKYEGNHGSLPLNAPFDNKKPIYFEYKFLISEEVYTYSLAIMERQIFSEKLEIDKDLVYQYENSQTTIGTNKEWQNNNSELWLETFKKTKAQITTPILRSLREYIGEDTPDYVKNIEEMLNKTTCFDTDLMASANNTTKTLVDLEVSDLELINLLKIADPSFREIVKDPLDNEKVEILHAGENSDYKIHIKQETGGFYKLLQLYALTKKAQFFFIDELDARMHYQLINYFLNNITGDQQWAITSHNIGVLENPKFEDNVFYTISKNIQGISTLRNLNTIKNFKNKSENKNNKTRLDYYLRGAYQGQPHLISLDLEG